MLAKPIEKSVKGDGNDDDKDKKTVSESPLLKSFSNADDFQSSNSSVLASSDEEESELLSSKSGTDTSFSTTIAEHPLFTIGDGSTATGSQAVSVKGEEESEGNMNEAAWSNSVFVDRVRSIPLVAAGFDQYETWKRYGKLTGLACSAVESTVATLSKPVLKTLEPFQSKVDEFGCKQLDLLEEKFPLIKENPDVLNRKAFATMTLLYETLAHRLNDLASKNFKNQADFHALIQYVDQAHVALTRASVDLQQQITRAQVYFDEKVFRAATLQLQAAIQNAIQNANWLCSNYRFYVPDWVIEPASKRFESILALSNGEALLQNGRDLGAFAEKVLDLLKGIRSNLLERLQAFKAPTEVIEIVESAKNIAISKFESFVH